jgi:hypothetical protein
MFNTDTTTSTTDHHNFLVEQCAANELRAALSYVYGYSLAENPAIADMIKQALDLHKRQRNDAI